MVFDSYTENINVQLLITTLFFMILGFIYFIYRLKRLVQPINIDDNEYINNNNINNNNNERQFHIIIQLERDRYNFDIKLTDNIGQFIREKIYPLTNNRDVYLLFQGQLLNQNQQFLFYEHRLADNIVIICKIRENVGGANLNNNHYNDNMEERTQEQLRNDPKAVSIYSICTHLCIIFILGFIIFCYKAFKEIFTKQTLLMIQILSIVWAISFSNTVTKLVYYKTISY